MWVHLRAVRERLESAMTSFQLWLGLIVFLPLAAVMLATATGLPTGRLLFDLLVWGGALGGSGWLLLRVAQVLRRRHVGDLPPREPMTRQDVLAHAVSLLIGPMLLYWFVPRLLEVRPESVQELWHEARARWVDALLAGIGGWLSLRPLVAWVHYIMRP